MVAMNGKKILVTGSSDGIGKQTALELARMGARVLIHGRNPQRALSFCPQSTQKRAEKVHPVYCVHPELPVLHPLCPLCGDGDQHRKT